MDIRIVVCALAALAAAPHELAAQTDTLTLARAVAIARAANPMLHAARLTADAALAQVRTAATLPDPQLTLGLMNRPLTGFGTAEPMTMNSVQVTQELPWPGKLGFAERRARALATASGLDADETEVALIARVQAVYFQLAWMDRSLAVMGDTRDLLRSFLQVATAMYGVGTGLQQDVLRAQVALARMTGDITVMTQDRTAMAARLNALLGRDATVSVGALDLPQPADSLPGPDSLMAEALAHRPALAAARARVDAAAAAYREARRALYPNLMLGVSYGARPSFDNMVSLMVGFSVPIWAGSRQLPLRRAMAAQASAAEADARNLTNETYAQLTELAAQATRARSLAELYRTSVVPQARAAVEAALGAYRVGRVEFMTLVDDQMTVNQYAIETIRLTADYDAAVAQIGALTGASVGGAR